MPGDVLKRRGRVRPALVQSVLLWVGTMIAVTPLRADDEEDHAETSRIPAVKPATDFYGASGTAVTVEATVEPTVLTTEDWLTLTLAVAHLSNAPDVEKPKLGQLEEFAKLFQVDDRQADPMWKPELPDRREFIYRLRPRSTRVNEIPSFTFRFFDPKRRVPPGQELQAYGATWTHAIPIVVQPPKEPPPTPAIPLDVPPFAESTADDATPGYRIHEMGSPQTALLALLLPPTISVGWAVLWKRRYPDAARLARSMRSKAARKARAALDRTADPAKIATIVLNYLHERYDVPHSTNTPVEVRTFLEAMGLPDDRCRSVESFFLRCDAVRFAPAAKASEEALARDAANTVAMLEEPTR